MSGRKIPKLISKSKLMRGYQCLKQIHLTVHHPQFESPITPDKQAVFDRGNEVGEVARDYFPGGVLVDFPPWDFVGSLKKTRELMSLETPVIYEAAFEYKGCYARTDIIKFQADTQRWIIYEVKSSTQVKDEHLQDIALQAWIMAKAGLPIEQINLVHLNKECIYPDLKNLFQIVDVTDQVRALYPKIQNEVVQIIEAIKQEDVPKIDIGPHCFSPYECGFKDHCFAEAKVPELSVLDLPNLRDKAWELYNQGIVEITDSRLTDLSDMQMRVVEAHRSGQAFWDKDSLKEKLAEWKFPLIFLDFETEMPAIPKYQGCRPYSQVPFQFSVHKLNSLDGNAEHFEFLWDQNEDPRPQLIQELLKACSGEGSVVAYYSQFESSRIKEMATTFPQFSSELLKITERMVDPLPLLRESVYDPAFKASFSLKNVAPALLGEESSYYGMAVADGGAAQRAYAEMLAEKDISKRQTIRADLLEYCKKDTEVLVLLYKKLISL